MDDRHEKVTVELSAEEALVLFELLSRWEYTKAPAVTFEHQAEQQVLSNILCDLESVLVEPFMPDYADRVRAAREQVQPDQE